MKFYFSGITSPAEYELHERSGATHLLVDQFHQNLIPTERPHTCVDSGAYAAWRKNLNLSWQSYLKTLKQSPPRDFYLSLDVIGDDKTTYSNWENLREHWTHPHSPLIPVWTWGTNEKHLQRYLDESSIVAIGGMVDIFRAKSENKEDKKELEKRREREFKKLLALCNAYPRRFHVLGLNWLAGLSELKKKDLIYSADTAKAYSAAKKNAHFSVNKNGTLVCTPLTYLQKHLPPETYQILITSRTERLTQAIQTIQKYFSG